MYAFLRSNREKLYNFVSGSSSSKLKREDDSHVVGEWGFEGGRVGFCKEGDYFWENDALSYEMIWKLENFLKLVGNFFQFPFCSKKLFFRAPFSALFKFESFWFVK